MGRRKHNSCLHSLRSNAFFPHFNQGIDENSLFEHVDYARHMKILCETGLIVPKKLNQLEGNFNRCGKAKDQ